VTATYPITTIEPAEFPAFCAVGEEAFNSSSPPESGQQHELLTFEFERSAAARDGDQIVGTACAYTFQLSVPGGTVDTGGVSFVGVSPAYRRRGIMSAMIDHLLTDIAGRGEPVAALFASEAEIYGRFGFGCASEQLRLTLRRGEGRLIPAAMPAGRPAPRIRGGEPAKGSSEMAAVYATVAAGRPGMPLRNDRWWQARIDDPEVYRDGSTPLRCIIAEDASAARGYALYSVKPNWGDDGISVGRLSVSELMGTDPEATAALWTDLLTRDLVGEVRTGARPVDDPLLQMLAGRRRGRPYLSDGLWIRLIDVPAALSQRRYACSLDLVIEVIDPVLPANAGRWRLQAGAGEPATCERTSAPADVIAPAGALGAAYLGGTRLGALAAAGQIAQERPGALAALSAAMYWDPAPWSPMIF
jgi:predicted acetyltransferase